jgi:RNA polymerase sigma factor (sigma-70 family)
MRRRGLSPENAVARDERDARDELAELVRRVRARDTAAEAALHARFRRFVEHRLREARTRRNWFWLDDLDDAVQEVFIQFFAALRAGKFIFEGEARLQGFLVHTAWFVAMNLKDQKKGVRTVSLFGTREDGENGLVLDLPAFAEAASERLHGRECTERLYRAIEELGGARKEVVLRTLAGEKVRDIVRATGKTASAVSGLKFNALAELREKLEANGFVRDCGSSGVSGFEVTS